MIYRCIAIHSVAIHVSIQQSKYRYINISMYRFVLINELFSTMDKTLKLTLYRKCCEINLVQYGDSHGFILSEEIILLLSVS